MMLNEELSNAYPGFEATADARRASQVAIRNRALAVQRSRRIRRSFAAAAFTVLAVAAFVSVGPKALAVYKLRKIEGAVDDAKTAEIDVYSVKPDGSQVPSGREFYDRGKWRQENGPSARIWEAGKLWCLDPSMKRVTVQSAPSGPFTYNPSGFSVRSMIADIARWNWRDRIDVGDGRFEGATVTQVTISSPNNIERIVVLADKGTSMPIAFRMESNTVGGWHLSGMARLQFDKPVDPRLFTTRFDRSLPVVDLDRMKSEFKSRIETPLATFPWMGKTIAIRAIDVNPNGHVFVMYTDGETQAGRQKEADALLSAERKGGPLLAMPFRSPRPDIEVKSSLGVDYLNTMNFQPYVTGATEQSRRGIVLRDGEVLQGKWFIPLHPSPWQAQTVTVTLNSDSATSYRRHFQTASTPLLPDWAPLMAMAPTVEEDVLREEFDVRRPLLQQGTDTDALIANLEGELAVRRKEESQGIGPWAKGDLYFALYQAHLKQGDRATALGYLRQAAEESNPDPGLDRALKKEHMR
jgi:hypothetical protein